MIALPILAVLIFVFIGFMRWRKANPAPVTADQPLSNPILGTFTTPDGITLDIKQAPPCDASAHGCKYVPTIVSATEPCQMTATEDAIKTVAKNTTRMKKMLVDARQALMDFTSSDAPAPVKGEVAA